MTRRHGPKKRTHQRGRLPERARATSASHRNRWIGVIALLAILATLGVLGVPRILRKEHRPPAPSVPVASSPEANLPATPEVELSPEEKLAALKAEELRLAEQLIEAFPNSAQPLVLLGNVYRRRGAFDRAVSAWEEAVQMNPQRSDVYDKIAQSAFETDEFEKAISTWQKALEVDPSMRAGHVKVARAMMRLGRSEEGIAEIHKEIALHPDLVLSYFVLGRTHQQLQEYEQAKANYEKTIALQPDHMNAYYGLYNVCARMKLQEEAKRYLAEFKRLQKKDEEAIRRLDKTMTDLNVYSRGLARLCFDAHDLYRENRDLSEAERFLKRAIALDPENTAFIERLIILYQARNRIPDALAWCHRIAEIDPENVTCQLNIGIFSVQVGRLDDAEKAFRRAIELSPEHHGGYQELARLYLRMKINLVEARELAEKAVALEPSALNHFLLGLACLTNEDPTAALPALKRAAELEPTNAKYAGAYNDTRKRMLSK